MLNKPLEEIGKDDIDSLAENEVSEGRTIDYKERLPGTSDADKREFLADISSFANASGGDILYGVSEHRDSDNRSTGIPEKAAGIAELNVDAERLRIDALIRDGIAPRIPNVRIQAVEGFEDGPVLIIRIPKSWASPHMVSFKNLSRFYSRHNAGKYQLDVTEIRSAFVLSEALPERIKRFRDDRLAKIVADETPVLLKPNPKSILHILPLVAFSREFHLDTVAMKAQQSLLIPSGGGSYSRFNIDGFLSYTESTGPGHWAYCQTFRNGVIEAVETRLLGARAGRIASTAYEKGLLKVVSAHLQALHDMEVPPPIVILLSLLGVAGVELSVALRFTDFEPTAIDRDLLLLPDVLVEDYGGDVARTMRPVFDAVWNAAGYERCLNYDEDGNWNPR